MNPLPHSLYPSFENATVVTVAKQQNSPKSRWHPVLHEAVQPPAAKSTKSTKPVGMRNMRNLRNECLRYLRYLRSPDQEIAVVRLSPILMQKALAPEELEIRTFTLSTFLIIPQFKS